jgi:hypothetical protein
MAGEMTVGFQIICAALSNILASSSLAIFNAWIFRQGWALHPHASSQRYF